jgi:hypothetical protein
VRVVSPAEWMAVFMEVLLEAKSAAKSGAIQTENSEPGAAVALSSVVDPEVGG